jgi:hypothetical protein
MNTATIPSPWTETTEESFQYSMDVLPPVMIDGLTAFMVSEPLDHCPTTGRGIYTGMAKVGDRYCTCDATVASFKLLYVALRKALA